MKRFTSKCFILSLSLVGFVAHAQSESKSLSLDEAVKLALKNDPWLVGSQYSQKALRDEAIASATLPDPKVSLMAGNFPTDSFSLNQEPMTQLSVSVTQMFERGETLTLKQKQKQLLVQQHPFLRADRRAKVTSTVIQLWLDAYEAQESIRLIEQDRALFEQLVDATAASYSVATGRARQQDVIRAQLELTRLSDRLTVLRQQQEVAQQRLIEWTGIEVALPTPSELPQLPLKESWLNKATEHDNQQVQYEWVQNHPAMQALESRIRSTQTGVDLAKQKYKPEWGVTAKYGYRDSDLMGRDRSDLLSIGVTFDLPIFTEKRQDKQVAAAIYRTEAMKTERQLLARRLVAELEAAKAQLNRADKRLELYTEQLLPQIAEQAGASLTAYHNDDGDFAEAVRARIAELNAKIDALAIAVERQQLVAQINYLLAQSSPNESQQTILNERNAQ